VAQRCSNDYRVWLSNAFVRVSPQSPARNVAFERLSIAIDMQRACISDDQ